MIWKVPITNVRFELIVHSKKPIRNEISSVEYEKTQRKHIGSINSMKIIKSVPTRRYIEIVH